MAVSEEKFNKWFNAFILIGMTVAVIITTVMKLGVAETGKVLLLVSAFGSLMGILSTVCSANGIIWTFLFGLIDVAIYAVVCFISGKYGNAAQHALYFVPMQFIGFWQWRKRGAHASDKKVQARRLSPRQWLLTGAAFLAISVAAYLILAHFDKGAAQTFIKTAVLMDALAMVCNIFGQYLMSTAYMEQWFFWIGVNIFSVIMWAQTLKGVSDSYAIIYIIKYSFYLINAFNGLRIWLGLSKNKELEK